MKYNAERMPEESGLGVTIRVPDMGGPETHSLPDLARTHLAYRGSRRPVLPVPLAGKAYAAFRRGGDLAPSTRWARARSRSSWPRPGDGG
ncbi:hypothetical protein WKI68_05620 [Streptomyces sp. MS1.HAVA.3]|uniref:Uncharacterized protein n=1 Tax=Streptomyces caledonius TaxID=3134107 RepID=A0ABU8TZP7_9ACTN